MGLFRLIIRDRDGTHRVADELALADFGGVEPVAGDFYVRTVAAGGDRQRQVFRVLCRVLKDQRTNVLAEWANSPDDLIAMKDCKW
jgi:hypothetical protein